MREIKRRLNFRAWDKEEKIMLDGIIDTVGKIIKDPRKRYELMQYTGLKDKNGKEIWEGDVVKVDGETGRKEVLFVVNELEDVVRFDYGEGLNGEESEVIGNIYEAPELSTSDFASQE